MEMNEAGSEKVDAAEADELSEMANLFPRTTGLPMTVWASHIGRAGSIRSRWVRDCGPFLRASPARLRRRNLAERRARLRPPIAEIKVLGFAIILLPVAAIMIVIGA